MKYRKHATELFAVSTLLQLLRQIDLFLLLGIAVPTMESKDALIRKFNFLYFRVNFKVKIRKKMPGRKELGAKV